MNTPDPADLELRAQGAALAEQTAGDLRDGRVPMSDRRVILTAMIARLELLRDALPTDEPA